MAEPSTGENSTVATVALPTGALSLLLRPTLTRQCWGFMLGSLLFALGSAPGFADWAGESTANLCYFIGAWGFTYAGFIQWILSGSHTILHGGAAVISAVWLSAATQSIGTILFNVSTSAALQAQSVQAQDRFVWTPDAGGSVLFLVSGALALRAYRHRNRWWNPRAADWWSTQINMIGCIAFGVSAVGAFVLSSGDVVSSSMANVGTFVGAICFFLASLVVLPGWNRSKVGESSDG